MGVSSQGIFNVLLHKQKLKDALLTWGLSTFAGEQTAVDWIQNVVTRKVQNLSTWAVLLKSGDVAWRAGRHHAEIGWLKLLTEATFGTSYDAPIKIAMKGDREARGGPREGHLRGDCGEHHEQAG